MKEPQDVRRPTRQLEEIGGEATWYMATLETPLSVKGYATARVRMPKSVTDEEIAEPGHTFDDEWRTTEIIIQKVWNGFTPDRTLESGTLVRIERYFGRWIVTQAEC